MLCVARSLFKYFNSNFISFIMENVLTWIYYESNNFTKTFACPPYGYFELAEGKLSAMISREKMLSLKKESTCVSFSRYAMNLAVPRLLALFREELNSNTFNEPIILH